MKRWKITITNRDWVVFTAMFVLCLLSLVIGYFIVDSQYSLEESFQYEYRLFNFVFAEKEVTYTNNDFSASSYVSFPTMVLFTLIVTVIITSVQKLVVYVKDR